ncbi:MAG TPA: hypothetical protein VEC35_09395 [Noviherbaspirillum sp.]|nr:hypothetical protein [Noviherbaspirillum sp.]
MPTKTPAKSRTKAAPIKKKFLNIQASAQTIQDFHFLKQAMGARSQAVALAKLVKLAKAIHHSMVG